MNMVEVPQARSGQQETSCLLGYPWNSTGSCPGGVIELAGNWKGLQWSSLGTTCGRTSAELLLGISVGLAGRLHPEVLLNSLGSWLGCMQSLLGSCPWGCLLDLLVRSAIACLSAGQVLKKQEVLIIKAPQNQEEKPCTSCSVPPAPSTDRG